MVRRLDDPMFNDRFFAHRITMMRIYIVMLAGIGFLSPSLWMLPLFLISIAVGGFPARKRIYNETWTLPRYLGNRLRMALALGGFWAAMLVAPDILQHIGASLWPVVMFILVLWFFFYQDLLLFGLDSERFHDPHLETMFEPILSKARAPRPALYRGGPSTGGFANAAALPRGKQSRVLLTRILLRELEPPEVTAIFAHEVAHLEQYARRGTTLRMWSSFILLPGLAVVPQVMCLTYSPQDAVLVSALWPILFLSAGVAAIIQRQKNETAADLRALELGADPLALMSGLEKIHKLNRAPRRFDAKREQRMSHPSLSRRIEAIRRKAGLAPATPPPGLPMEIATRKAATSLRFTPEALEIVDEQRTRQYRYEALHSVAIRQTIGGQELVATGAEGRIRMPLDGPAAQQVHAILNFVDSRLAAAPPKTKRTAARARIAAVFALLMSLMPGIPFPPILASIATLISPGRPAVAALSGTSIAAAILAFVVPSPFSDDTLKPVAVVLGLLGFACMLMARTIDEDAKRPNNLLLTLVVLATGGTAVLLIRPSWSAVTVVLVGIAATFATRRRPPAPLTSPPPP